MFILASLSKRTAVMLVSSINSPRIELYSYGKVLLEKHAHNHVSESTLSDMESMHHCLFFISFSFILAIKCPIVKINKFAII